MNRHQVAPIVLVMTLSALCPQRADADGLWEGFIKAWKRPKRSSLSEVKPYQGSDKYNLYICTDWVLTQRCKDSSRTDCIDRFPEKNQPCDCQQQRSGNYRLATGQACIAEVTYFDQQ